MVTGATMEGCLRMPCVGHGESAPSAVPATQVTPASKVSHGGSP